MKKVLLIGSVVAASGLALAGCSNVTVESLFTEATTAQENAKSMTGKIIMDADIEVDMSGTTLALTMKADGTTEVVAENNTSHVAMNTTTSTLGMEYTSKSEVYTIANEDDSTKIDVYTGQVTGDEDISSWTKSLIDVSDLNSVSTSANSFMPIYTENKDAFVLKSGTENYNETECYVVTSSISLDKLINSISSLGSTTSSFSSLGIDDTSSITVDMVYYFSKDTKEIKGVVVDMASGMKSALEQAMSSQYPNAESSVTINSFKIEVTVDAYDTLTSIEIPQTVIDAAV